MRQHKTFTSEAPYAGEATVLVASGTSVLDIPAYRPTPLPAYGAARVMHAANERHERNARRSVMQAARDRRANVVAAIRSHDGDTPNERPAYDAVSGRLPLRSAVTIAEHHPATDARLTAFENVYAYNRRERQTIEAVMRHGGSNEGRGAIATPRGARAPVMVNGTETRVTRRWQSTPRRRVDVPVRDAHGRVVAFEPLDTTVYVVNADGTREPWQAPAVERTTAMRRTSGRDASAAIRFAARVGLRADTTLADGTS